MTDNASTPRPTPRYDNILAAASRTAEELGHGYVGTEHLLLALLADSHAVATQAVERFVPAATVIEELHRVLGSEEYNTPRMWPPDA